MARLEKWKEKGGEGLDANGESMKKCNGPTSFLQWVTSCSQWLMRLRAPTPAPGAPPAAPPVCHMVGDATILTGLRLPPAGMTVTFGSGSVLPVAAVGEIRQPWFSIPDVYLVPGLTLNLISVRQLDRGSGIYAVFCNGRCGLWDARPGRGLDLVGVGAVDVARDMYRLSFLEVPPRLLPLPDAFDL